MSLLTREPVRAAFLTTVTAVLGLLVALDVIDDATSVGIGAAVVALVGLTAELTRARVTPVVAVTPATPAGEDGLTLVEFLVGGLLLILLFAVIVGYR